MKANEKVKTVYIAIKYLINGQYQQGFAQLDVKSDIGTRKTVKDFFERKGIADYKYKTFNTRRKAAMCYID